MISAAFARRFRLACAVVVSTGLLLPALAVAQDAAHQHEGPFGWPSLSELVERSESIVAGEVLDMRSVWTADRSQIFTTVTLRTDRRLKGSGSALVRFRIPGGTVGDTRLRVTHAPHFAIGERALVFLSGSGGRLPVVVAAEAGKRHLRMDENGDETILPGFALAQTGAASSVGPRGSAPEALDTLDELAAALPRLAAANQYR